MDRLERHRKERKQVRRAFTVSLNEVEAALKENTIDEDKVRDCFASLHNKAERLLNIEEKVREILISGEIDVTEEDLDKEFDASEAYYDKWVKVKTRYERAIAPPQQCNPIIQAREPNDRMYASSENFHVAEGSKRNYRLPTIEFEKFDGDVRNWINFWGQFKKIHEDHEMEDDDKYRYLKLATTGIANVVVKKYPSSGYENAVGHLKSRFGKEETLIEVYVRELLRIVLQKSGKNLADLVDQLETQLGALDSLGVTSDKYACMLYPIVESALPEDVLKAWERTRTIKNEGSESCESATYLQQLLAFLRCEVESEERIRLARSGFDTTYKKASVKIAKSQENDTGPTEPTAASLAATTSGGSKLPEKECFFCAKTNHSSVECFRASSLPYDERKDRIVKAKACLICLRKGHTARNCKAFVKCFLCQKKHHVVMCPDIQNNQSLRPQNSETKKSTNSENLLANHNSPTLLQTLQVEIATNKGGKIVRALLDSGSQKSYITKQCVLELGVKKEGEELIAHSLFGGIQTQREAHNIYHIKISNLRKSFNIIIPVLEQEKICNFVPRMESRRCISELKKRNIVLSDVGVSSAEISLLIGADVIGKLLTGEVHDLANGLTAVNTKLGWTVMGQCKNYSYSRSGTVSSNLSSCLFSLDISDLWRLDVLGIKDSSERKTTEQLAEETLEHFQRTVCRNEENRYEIRLPWMEGHPELGDNRAVAVKRLMSTTRKLKAIGKLRDYHKVFSEWLDLRIIEVVPSSEAQKHEGCHYIPHQAVIKEARVTTKIRPVFDASAKDSSGTSLNACLANGPNLLEKIPNLLINFRQNAIGVISDVTKAFLQICISPSDRDYLRFFWWEDENAEKMITYRHCRVVFGLTPSPFLLEATIAHHLSHAPEELRCTANKLKDTFYVDNSVTSVDNEEQLDRFIREATQVMELGCFELRGWVSSLSQQGTSEFTEKETISVLGLLWNYKEDTLGCDVSSVSLAEKPLTRRKLLSVAQRVFDPIGFTCPVTLIPKLLLQQTWELKCGWDGELPLYLTEKFENWLADIHWLNRCQIPRWFMGTSQFESASLHVFSDGSKDAYSACIFLRVEGVQGVTVQLLSAKARIAPLKKLTIPRMELMGALIGARLYNELTKSIQISYTPYFWTDSSVVLTWLTWKNDWNTFVSNRCREIMTLSNAVWKHVPGELNPADLPSRGCFGKRLFHSRWWEGPEWLKEGRNHWPSQVIETPDENAFVERRKTVISTLTQQQERFTDRFEKFSSYFRVIRVAAWVRRALRTFRQLKVFREGVKRGTLPTKREELTYNEIADAERRFLRNVQKEGFSSSDSKILKRLQSYHDEHGLLRIKTRLLPDETEEGLFTNPVLLPARHMVVSKLILSEHLQANHAGPQILMCILRQRYWITKARKTIRGVLAKCTACQKFRAKAAEPPVAPLPKDRVSLGGVFEVSGVDLAGPLYLKDKTKVWIVLFTCAVYRAVHLELTTSLSTEAFLQALRRFIARRGRVNVLYSDNATNFVGANNALKTLNWEEIVAHSNMKRIEWKFNHGGEDGGKGLLD